MRFFLMLLVSALALSACERSIELPFGENRVKLKPEEVLALKAAFVSGTPASPSAPSIAAEKVEDVTCRPTPIACAIATGDHTGTTTCVSSVRRCNELRGNVIYDDKICKGQQSGLECDAVKDGPKWPACNGKGRQPNGARNGTKETAEHVLPGGVVQPAASCFEIKPGEKVVRTWCKFRDHEAAETAYCRGSRKHDTKACGDFWFERGDKFTLGPMEGDPKGTYYGCVIARNKSGDRNRTWRVFAEVTKR